MIVGFRLVLFEPAMVPVPRHGVGTGLFQYAQTACAAANRYSAGGGFPMTQYDAHVRANPCSTVLSW